MEGGGTPNDVRAFVKLLENLRARAGRPVSIAVSTTKTVPAKSQARGNPPLTSSSTSKHSLL
jgi:hypothetical protein